MSVCVKERERERESVCVCVRERESENENNIPIDCVSDRLIERKDKWKTTKYSCWIFQPASGCRTCWLKSSFSL